MKWWSIGLTVAAFGIVSTPMCRAQEIRPSLITAYKTQADGKSRTYVSGIINLDRAYTEAGSGCEQWIGPMKIVGIQFSPSGTTLDQVRFKDTRGNLIAVPTNFATLSNAERGAANSFIREGQTYFTQVQVCGSGGFASLVNIYNISSTLGAFN